MTNEPNRPSPAAPRHRPARAALMFLGGFAVAALLSAAPIALAQQAPPTGGDHLPPRPDPAAHFKEMCDNGPAHIAGLLAFAETRLAITDAQKPAWTHFVEKFKAAHQPLAKLCADEVGKPMPKDLPGHLHKMEAMATAEAQTISGVRAAVDEIFPQLTPEQQAKANEIAEKMHEHGGPMGGHPPFPGMHP